jgi:hypothetical protein
MTSQEGESQKDEYSYYSAFQEFLEEFRNESDRAAVILGAAKLDYLLYQILYKFLLPSVSNNDELLMGDSPLSTFSAKINMCHRLGLIDSEFARALHLTRRIRNAFAHETSGCKLDAGPHRDRVRELAAPFTRFARFSETKKIYFEKKSDPSADFFTVLTIMVIRLESIFDNLEPIQKHYNRGLIPPYYLKELNIRESDAEKEPPDQLSEEKAEGNSGNSSSDAPSV